MISSILQLRKIDALSMVATRLQDYRVHIKHLDGSFEYIPYFCLPANDLTDVIAPSCYSCFDYPNALADLVRFLHPIFLLLQSFVLTRLFALPLMCKFSNFVPLYAAANVQQRPVQDLWGP